MYKTDVVSAINYSEYIQEYHIYIYIHYVSIAFRVWSCARSLSMRMMGGIRWWSTSVRPQSKTRWSERNYDDIWFIIFFSATTMILLNVPARFSSQAELVLHKGSLSEQAVVTTTAGVFFTALYPLLVPALCFFLAHRPLSSDRMFCFITQVTRSSALSAILLYSKSHALPALSATQDDSGTTLSVIITRAQKYNIPCPVFLLFILWRI